MSPLGRVGKSRTALKTRRDDGRARTWKGSHRCQVCHRRIEHKGLCGKCTAELEVKAL